MDDQLKPGMVVVSEARRSICLGVEVYGVRDSNNRIRIVVTDGEDLSISVTDQRNPQGIHRALFRPLRERLIKNGAWPFDDSLLRDE